jgi:molybdopterin-binding protein
MSGGTASSAIFGQNVVENRQYEVVRGQVNSAFAIELMFEKLVTKRIYTASA